MSAPPRFGVVGQPVHRSLSPAIFGFLFERMKVAGVYERRETAPDDLANAVAEMRDGRWQGLSVTAPHKLAVRDLIDDEEALARRIGAVNTLVPQEHKIIGHNTDAHGCAQALAQAGAGLKDASVVVIGAGGAARAGVFAALDGGARKILIANRTRARAEALAEDAGCDVIEFDARALTASLASADILIQSSSAGMGEPDISALPDGVTLSSRLTILDMVYRPLDTALLRQGRAAGCRTIDGLWMLVHQALQQFRLWTGREAPPETARALHEHLRGSAT